jgi:hypothetical protein
MKDDHKDDINKFVDNMTDALSKHKYKMESLRKDPNPRMADIDELVRIFGVFEKPTSSDSKK